MGSERKVPDLKAMGIDLDDIDVEVLFIARNPKLLKATTTFLNRRGWRTTIMSDVTKAIEFIADRQPDFILTSLNHPSPAVLKLPDLVQGTFNLHCIGFTEVLDNASSARLQRSRYPHKMIGQASGPNVHRLVRKILADKLGLKEDGTRIGGKAANGGTIIQKSSAGLMNRPGQISPPKDAEKDVVSTGKYTMAKNTKRSLKELLHIKSKGLDETATGDRPLNWKPDDDLVGMLKRKLFGEDADDGTREPESHTKVTSGIELLEKTVEVAFSDVCDMQAGELHGILAHVDRVGVFPVSSSDSPGYLVIASSMPERESEEFFRGAEVALQKAFSAMNIAGIIESGFAVSVPHVEFGSWSATKAAFTIVLAHKGYEVGAAFFRTEDQLPAVRDSGHQGMLAVNVADIGTNHPVNFKAYLHMKKNDKFFLYLRNGRVLQPEQKERLTQSNVSDFFMKSVDRENIRMFLAASFLRGTMKKDDSGEGAA